MSESTQTKVRMVGHLLLAHPTTKVEARSVTGSEVCPLEPTASCFCYTGAAKAVSNALDKNTWDWWELSETCDTVLGEPLMCGEIWDNASPKQRKAWATKLANYKENE